MATIAGRTHIFGYSLENSQWQSSPKNGGYSHINRIVSDANITFPVGHAIYHARYVHLNVPNQGYCRNTPCEL